MNLLEAAEHLRTRIPDDSYLDDKDREAIAVVEAVRLERPATASAPTYEHDVRNMAREQWSEEGTLEIDDNAVISDGDDNGAYVQAWVWVSFAGTQLDKEIES